MQRTAGWLIVLYAGLVCLVLTLGTLVLFFANDDLLTQEFPLMITALLVLAGIHVMGLFAGLRVIHGRADAHVLAIPFSIAILFNVPIGTIVGAVYLSVHYSLA